MVGKEVFLEKSAGAGFEKGGGAGFDGKIGQSIHLFANWQHHYHAKPEFQIKPTKDPMLYNISLTNDQNKNKKKI